tara:strand:+ start:183 stop:758 length:576 start_codon:yes stop_codon:yes gene_type:complete
MKLDVISLKNFYDNPYEVREMALKLDYNVTGNFPGGRTKPYLSKSVKNSIEQIVYPYGGKITKFNEEYNGAFQITYSWDKSWIHADNHNTWAAVCYLTPNAPSSAGTGFFKHRKTGMMKPINGKTILDKKIESEGQENFKWEMIQSVSNEFNKIVVYDSKLYHSSLDYFGDTLQNGRLFQVFFFDTERSNR